MFVCICQGITDRSIREAVANGAESMQDVAATLGVATNCGQCFELAQSIVNEQLFVQAEQLAYAAA